MSRFADPRTLYFFFDYISHNAYLAWTQLPALAQKHGLRIEPVPVLFAGLLSHYKQVGPAEVPAKSRWMLWNVLRKAQALNVPIEPPHSHPFNPLVPLRTTCGPMSDAERLTLVDQLFRATWAESQPVSDAATVARLAGAARVAESQTEAVKAQLRANTDDALKAGVFGVPTMLVRGELFWGFDDLEYLQQFLEGRDPVSANRSAYQSWFAVLPSATRKR
ncbi:MAG: 2-hydroxychromene-2-carboxylate isomerase [Pseudomonadota bacterium]